MQKNYVSVYAQFTLKNAPKGYRGLRGENWNFGKKHEMSLHDLSLLIISRLTEFYLATMQEKSTDEINAQIERLSETLAGCSIKEDQRT